MTSAFRLRLFKLRMFDDHCGLVPSHDDRGEAIEGPGVDLRGADAAAAFETAAPLLEMLRQRGQGGKLRAVSVHLEHKRAPATFEPSEPGEKPAAVRVDGDAFGSVLSLAAPVMHYLADRSASRLANRRFNPPLPVLAKLTAPEPQRTSSGYHSGSGLRTRQGSEDVS